MSEVCLVVREADRDWSGKIHGSCADRAIAALSADPMTLSELEAATGRFEKPKANSRFYANLSPGLCAEPHDVGLVIIDLAARFIVVDSTYSSPALSGDVCYHNGRCCTDEWIRYHLADDWQLLNDGAGWQEVAEARRRERAETPLRDIREVLYGRPMLGFIASKTFAAFAQREAIVAAMREKWMRAARERLADKDSVSPEEVDPSLLTDEAIVPKTYPGQEQYASPFYDTLKEIHAAWLLTPRDDLGGECPRTVALRQRDHIEWNLQDRCEQWSRFKEPPPALDESSFAFRYGGFGSHELVEYYELVRHLLWSCWDRLEDSQQNWPVANGAKLPSVDDFLATEIARLENDREQWLDTPDPELDMRTPRSIIHNERIRMPEAVSGQQAMVDPDCPCCQMLADVPGPGFWHLDGCSMDDEFAFDLYNATREEWEQERGAWEERAARFEAEENERKRLGVADAQPYGDGAADKV